MKDYTEKNIACTASSLYPRKNYNIKHAFKETVLKFKELGYSYYEGKYSYIYFRIYLEAEDNVEDSYDSIASEIIINIDNLSYMKRGGFITNEEHKVIAEILDYCKLFGAEFSKNYLRSSNFLENWGF